MKLLKGERYTLKSNLFVRTSFSAGTIPTGETIEIQQVDQRNKKYLVDNVWFYHTEIEKVVM